MENLTLTADQGNTCRIKIFTNNSNNNALLESDLDTYLTNNPTFRFIDGQYFADINNGTVTYVMKYRNVTA
jgi:hypothetical protein